MIYTTLLILIVSLVDLTVDLEFSLLCASDDLIENATPGGPTTPLCKFQGTCS